MGLQHSLLAGGDPIGDVTPSPLPRGVYFFTPQGKPSPLPTGRQASRERGKNSISMSIFGCFVDKRARNPL